jgi:thiol:disulfide interchange protein DsbD
MASVSFRSASNSPSLAGFPRLFAPFFHLLFALLIACTAMLAVGHASAAEDYLEPDAAFKFTARMQDAGTVAITYEIADGYYMYRERFKFTAESATLGNPSFPAGKVKFDETFQKNVETYRHSVTITIPVQAPGLFTLKATSQGCADAGLCYAPQDASARLMGSTVALSTPAPATAIGAPAMSLPPAIIAGTPVSRATPAAPAAKPSELGGINAVLAGGKLLAIIPAFILLGLGLAFTPCVLPMVPILSSIIVGEGAEVRRARGLLLSITYALGMALVYTTLGVAAGLLGEGLAAALQNPWVLGGFGVLIVAMALSMFGVYELQLPAALQTRLTKASGRQASGKLAGVFAMGAISALIVGPCVAAPLAGALVYISQTRNVVIGGAALFAMAVGMSIPLLLVGVSAGSLLPRAGAWMDAVKRFFGVLMLAMAIWLVSPVLPGWLQMTLWAALLMGYGFYLMRPARHWGANTLGGVLAVLGVLQLMGLASGGRDPLAPLAHLDAGAAQAQGLHFTRVKTVAQLDAALAQTGGKTALLDFYADWCVSCKEMEKLTFVDPAVKARLADTVLLQVDVTANDADDKAMLKRFTLFGPPGIILFDGRGQEIPDSRVIGYQDSAKFTASLAKLK